MTYTATKAPFTPARVVGAGVANAVRLKLLNNSSKGITLPNVEFLAHAFAGIGADEVPWLAGFPGDVAKAPHSVWFGSPAIPLPRFIRADSNHYVCVSTFKRAEDGRYRRRKDRWAGLWLVLLDDIGTKIPFEALRLEPSCLVETSPGNFQAWLFLAQPERDPLKAEALINGLIKAGASDPGAGNLTRYGRLPTGINGKAKYQGKDGQPFAQRTHIWEPSRRHTPERIAQAYGFDLEAASRPRAQRKGTKPFSANRHVEVLDAAGLYIRPISGMHGAHQIICPWWEQHTDKDQTGTIYFEPHEQNGGRGGFKCQHGHCADRSIADLDYFILTLQRKAARAAA
ncbi:DNA-primase RepB domain-containing protein [Zoogloea sp.]|uniref:DNA-primase RepB domain-containing protein n=1 Tax=Zoogloea sp. TaxID=49181 RepID=UPI0035B44DDE